MDVYERLNVKKYINAYDTMTMYGSTCMDDDVLDSYKQSADCLVDMFELQDKIGERIAQLSHNEAAYITTGASMGITLAIAGCMAGTDRYLLSKLPNTNVKGMKNEVIIMRAQRNPYDKAVENAGAKIVEIGNLRSTEAWELEGAINENTAAVYYIQATNYSHAAMDLKQVIEIAHKHNVKVVVDAAAQLPPISNLHYFTDMGADMVAFSGCKAIRGPLSIGFVVGKKELVEACKIAGFPNRGVGRGGKISREDMVAFLLAFEKFVSYSEGQYDKILRDRCNYFIERLKDNQLLKASIEEMGPVGQIYPRVEIRINSDKFDAQQFAQAMKDDEIGILVGLPLEKPYYCIYINPMTIRDKELDIIYQQLIKVSERLAK